MKSLLQGLLNRIPLGNQIQKVTKNMGHWASLALLCWVTLGKSPKLSGLQCPHVHVSRVSLGFPRMGTREVTLTSVLEHADLLVPAV